MEMKKLIATGIIFLFIGVAVAPSNTANKVDELLKIKQNLQEKFIPVNRYEFKSDGSIEKTTILLPQREYLQMRQDLSLTHSIDENFNVFKKYGILPSDASFQKIKENFDQSLKVKKINITAIQNYVRNQKIFRFFGVTINSHCKISVGAAQGIKLNLGMNAIIKYYNILAFLGSIFSYSYPFYLPGIDLFDFCFSFAGVIDTWDGVLPNSSMRFYLFTMLLVGFVGYCIDLVPVPFYLAIEVYNGYAAFILGAGIFQ